VSAWAEAAEQRRGLRGRARLAVDGSDGAVHVRGNQILAIERPARLRVEIQGFLDQTVAVLVTDGLRFELFRASDHAYETGEVYPGLLWEQAGIALTPEEAVELLLGAPAPGAGLRPAGALSDGLGGVQVDLADASGQVRRRAGFDVEQRLRWVEAFGADGLRVWRAEFDDYSQVNGAAFAHALSLEVEQGETRAEITLRDVELNPALSPDIFRLRAPEPHAGGAAGQGG